MLRKIVKCRPERLAVDRTQALAAVLVKRTMLDFGCKTSRNGIMTEV